MFTLSYLFATVCGLLFFFLGWLVNKLIEKNKYQEWQPRCKILEKDKSDLTKQLNKEQSQVENLRKKSESWKHEFHSLTQENQLKAKEFRSQIDDLRSRLAEGKSDYSKLKLERDKVTTTLERTRKELEKLKEKYDRDVAAGKEWRTDRAKMEREVKDLQSRLERQTVLANDYEKKYTKQAEEINKIRVMERELRMLKTKTKALEKDVTYWEKKHYDTHHELAALKKDTESITSKYSEIEELRKGDEILKSNLMQQIQEFKTKFVDVNNKYRKILDNSN